VKKQLVDMSFVVKIKLADDTRRISFKQFPTFLQLKETLQKIFLHINIDDYVVKYQDEEDDLVTITSDLEVQEAFNVIGNKCLRITLFAKNSPPTVPKVEEKNPEQPEPEQPKSASVPPPCSFDNPFFTQILNNPCVSQILNQNPHIKSLLDPFLNASNFTFTSKSNPPSSEKKDGVVIHPRIVCDGCNMAPLVGVRYQCANCPDYDLCSACEAKGIHKDKGHYFLKIDRPREGPACYIPPMRRRMHCPMRFPRGHCSRWNRESPRALTARFIKDITVPDGSEVAPGTRFIKIWRLRNDGEQAWPQDTRLSFVGGDKLSEQDYVLVGSVAPGQSIDVAVDLTAPTSEGKYVSFFRPTLYDGSRFGNRVWVEIMVVEPEQPKQEEDVKENASECMEEEKSAEVSKEVKVEEVKAEVKLEEKKEEVEVEKEGTTVDDLVDSFTEDEKEYDPYEGAVNALVEMGFSDEGLIRLLLEQNGGDMMNTLQHLLAQ
jgi:hypothetical protein